jgi:pantothenate kinase
VDAVKSLREVSVTDSNNLDKAISVPSFDHAKKDPVERDICVLSSQKIVLLEGNYLLLNENPWKVIQGLVDET